CCHRPGRERRSHLLGRAAGATSPLRVTRPLQINVSRNAQVQIEEAAAWCGVGAQARGTKLQGVRRVTLSRIRYYVYYRATDQALEVYGKRFRQWADQPVAIFATVGESSRLRKGCGNKASRKGKFGLRHDT